MKEGVGRWQGEMRRREQVAITRSTKEGVNNNRAKRKGRNR